MMKKEVNHVKKEENLWKKIILIMEKNRHSITIRRYITGFLHN